MDYTWENTRSACNNPSLYIGVIEPYQHSTENMEQQMITIICHDPVIILAVPFLCSAASGLPILWTILAVPFLISAASGLAHHLIITVEQDNNE